MGRFAMCLVVLALGGAAAGCASGRKHDVAVRATAPQARQAVARSGPRIAYPAVGVTLTAAPRGYRAAVSRAEVLRLLRRTPEWRYIEPKASPSARVLTVADPSSKRDAYPAWVITNRRPGSNCAFVSIYSLRSRVWIWHFHSCTHRKPIGPSCDFGCTPANQDALDVDAQAAERIATRAYYTGVAIDGPSNKVDLYLAHAPTSILDRLRATHPGVYVIHDDAPRTLRAVKKIMRSFSFDKLKSQGIQINAFGPTVDGYLQVGVGSHVAEAQAKLDAIYGRNVIRVVKQKVAVSF
jgi:hypothetical protein